MITFKEFLTKHRKATSRLCDEEWARQRKIGWDGACAELNPEIERLENFIAENEIILTSAHTDVENFQKYAEDLKADYDTLQASQNDIACALGRYGRHDDGCPMKGKYIGGKKCVCGFEKVKQAISEAKKIEEEK